MRITNAITNNGYTSFALPRSWARVLFLCLLDAAIVTMYDLGVDPVFVHNGCVCGSVVSPVTFLV